MYFIIENIKPLKFFIIGQFFVAIIWAIELSLRPYLIKLILNKVSIIESIQDSQSLLTSISLYVLLAFFTIFTFRFYDWLNLNLQPNLRKNLNVAIMKYAIDHSHNFYQKHFSGSLSSKINDISSEIPILLNTFIDRFFSHTLGLIFAIYTLWIIDFKLASCLILWVTFFLLTSFGFSSKGKKLSNVAAEMRSSVIGQIVDIFSNIMSVRLFNMKRHELDLFKKNNCLLIEKEQKRDWFFLKMTAVQELSFILFQIVCFIFLVLGLKNKTTTPGDFALILVLNLSLVSCLQDLARDIMIFSKSLGNVTQGFQTIFNPDEPQSIDGDFPLILPKGEIIFDHVCFGYQKSRILFKDVSLKINPGEKIGLVGYSGGGKSTFVSLILRLFDVVQGRILLDKIDIRHITLNSLRHAIAMIPQDPSLFHRSIMDNIRYGDMTASDEKVIAAAKKADAHDFISQLPNGYQELVGEKGIKFSGGERQRIILARAILKDAPILILDEATSQLDSVTESKIQKILEILRSKTIIVVAHRLSTLIHMDRIFVFDKGNIVQEGRHEELLENDGLYKKLWTTQMIYY